MLTLRPRQHDALAALDQFIEGGGRRPIVMFPTGGGKTVVFSHFIDRRLGRSLVLAHRDELVRQAADKVRMVTGRAPGIVKAEEDGCQADVVVASVQTLMRPARLDRLMGRTAQAGLFGEPAPSPFRTVIVDECHHASADSYVQVLRGLGCFDADGPVTVGFTATPERSDERALSDVFERIVYSCTILDGIREGWLCDIRAKQIKLDADFAALHVRAGEFRDEETAELLLAADAPRHAAEAYGQHARERTGVLFTPTVSVARAMASAFTAAGIASEHVDGDMPLEQRRAILERLRTGRTRVVPNAQVLTEGWDEPSVSCCVMARPTCSRPLAIQCVGRVLRPHPGKADALVLDLVGRTVRMDLVTVADLFEVDAHAAEAGVLQATNAKARAAQANPAAADEDDTKAARLVALDVDLFKGRAFVWAQGPGGRFSLDLGRDRSKVVVMPSEKEPGRYDVMKVHVEADGKRWLRGQLVTKWKERREPLYAGMDLGYATGAAEDYMRKAGAANLNAKDAAWRSEPASQAQREALERRGRWVPGMTKGQASDAMNARGRRLAG